MRFALACLFALSACAQGSDGETAVTRDAGKDIASDAFDDDAPPGTIFDAAEGPCTPGTKAACKTSCGTIGDATCDASSNWGKCAARAGDPCTGLDCSGKGDGLEHTYFKDADGDGHGDPKSTTQACTAPSGTTSHGDDCDDANIDVHPGATETCNGKDDDCNGAVDDGLPRVTIQKLDFSAVPPCAVADPASCKRGAYEWCRAKSACFSGGFGPVELGATDGYFVCVGPGTLVSGWADVNAAQPGCSSDALAGSRVCESAVHRAGRNKGHESAILQTHAPGDWSFLPLESDHAKTFSGITWSELGAKHAGCTLARVDTYDCNAAVHRWCSDKGYVSGYGPVEYNDTEAYAVCVK